MIIALGEHTQKDDVGCGRLSSTLDYTHTVVRVGHDNSIISLGQHTQSGVKCNHSLVDGIDGRMKST